MDEHYGDLAEFDFASYHVPVCTDVTAMEADWIEEDDRHLNPMDSNGIGEIGIVGTAAAIGNQLGDGVSASDPSWSCR